MSVVFDTSVLIDVLRGDTAALRYVRRVTDVPICSEVARLEVARGLRSRERTSAGRLRTNRLLVETDALLVR